MAPAVVVDTVAYHEFCARRRAQVMGAGSGPKTGDFYAMRSELLPTVDDIADLARRLADQCLTESDIARARSALDQVRTRSLRRMTRPPDF